MIAVLSALVICCVCLVVEKTKRHNEKEKTKQEIIKEALQSLLKEGYIDEYLALVREQMGDIKQQAKQAKTKRTNPDGDEPFAAFLEEIHELCTSE